MFCGSGWNAICTLKVAKVKAMNTTTNNPPFSETDAKAIDHCNSLLRGEISAVETYGQAIDKFSNEPEVVILKAIRDDHRRAVTYLTDRIHSLHGLAETSSGAWGATTKAIQATANFFGEDSAIRSLEQGEELGQQAYESAINDADLEEETRLIVRDRLLPMVNQHINRLQTLSESLSQ